MPVLRLDAIRDETADIREFVFRMADGSVAGTWEAGAHLEFDLGEAGTRAYSLIDWPQATDGYVVAVKREDGGQGGSQAMHDLRVGDTVETSDPANDFPLDPGVGPVLLLAGGIGITPMISMASALQAGGRVFQLHHATRSRSVAAYGDALEAAFGDALCRWFDDETPLDLQALMNWQTPGTSLYICGPKAMIDAARAAAETAGITDIHVELFATPASARTDTGSFEVEINDGRVFTIPADKSIIDVLEDAGVDLMYDCQRGDCGICQCDVISGTPDHHDVVLTAAEKVSGTVMQICVSRAKSDRLVLDI